MKNPRAERTRAVVVCTLLALGGVARAEEARSTWVWRDDRGKLAYRATPAGDRITDFSHAGYRGGGVALPAVPVVATVQPVEGDDTASIQRALDEAGRLPLRDGFRGAVLLAPGTFDCAGTLTLAADGVVLRGSGSGSDPAAAISTLRLTGKPHLGIAVRAPAASDGEDVSPGAGPSTTVADDYVPSGASSFTVTDAAGFQAGDEIVIRRPVTEAWVRFMQMHDLVRDGKPQTWIRAGSVVTIERRITALEGRRLTLDIPLPDSFDARYLNPPGTTVTKAGPTRRVREVGIESLHLESPLQEISHNDPHFTAARLDGEDCWMRDVVIDETMNSVGTRGRRMTLERVTIRRRAKHQGASRPMEFAPDAAQVLLDRCVVSGDNIWFVGTGARVGGPVAILNCVFLGHGRAESHQRWSTALLYDNCRSTEGAIEMRNRGSMGSGHGWAMGWGVIWNCDAPEFLVQNPPGAVNWLIGGTGRNRGASRPFGQGPELPRGIEESPGQPVEPRSLYLSQLVERLGPQALRNIGYASTDPASALVSNPAGRIVPAAPAAERRVNLAKGRPVLATNVRSDAREFAAWLAIDDDDATAWAVDDGVAEARLELDTEGAVEIDSLELGEARGATGRVRAWKIEGFTADTWRELARGETIGDLVRVRLAPVTIWKIRLSILRADGAPMIRHLGIYRTRPVAP